MLPEKILQQLQALFASHPQIERVYVYGSYATGRVHPYSDIDLALFSPALSAADFARLQYQVQYEMPTLIPLEIARLDEAAADFAERVQTKGRVIYERTSDEKNTAYETVVAGSPTAAG